MNNFLVITESSGVFYVDISVILYFLGTIIIFQVISMFK